MRSVALLVVAVAGLAACGSASSTPSSEESTSLTITYRAAPGAAPVVRTLRCRPAAGTLPRPGRACLRLLGMADPLAPVPPDAVCTEIYGGPQTALVTGTLHGKRVWTRFARRNGCEIDRWTRHAFLFPPLRPGGG